MRMITVAVVGAEPAQIRSGTAVRELLPATAANGLPVLGALVNNEVVSLNYRVLVSCTVAPLTLADPHGWRVYRWSLGFLLAAAMRSAAPQAAFRVQHSMGNGLYCSATWPADDAVKPLEARVEQVEQAMRELVARDLPIETGLVSYQEALESFEEAGDADTLNLLRHRNPPHVMLVRCGAFSTLAQSPVTHRTGLLSLFRLVPREPGFVLDMPSVKEPRQIAPFEPQPHLFHIYQEHISWGRILGMTTIGQLNECVVDRTIDDIIQTAEALHEKKLAGIAADIAGRRPAVRLVLAAGPSSAGKTTFAKRLIFHLRVNGLRPVLISTDDYFVGDERNPRDEQGKLDYEHIASMDLPRLNRDLLTLMAGGEAHLPVFDFVTKTSHDRAEALRLDPHGVIVMEGIHCLNPQLTAEIPAAAKYRIYVSALTQLGIDSHNRISTTDNRLIRRLVRDNQFRGRPALPTLQRWASVSRGEERWIFPFQHLCDVTFNSALDYELAVLKTFAVPLLNEVKPWHPEYAEARRLTGFLHNFIPIPATSVPGNSILREYIGGSLLRY